MPMVTDLFHVIGNKWAPLPRLVVRAWKVQVLQHFPFVLLRKMMLTPRMKNRVSPRGENNSFLGRRKAFHSPKGSSTQLCNLNIKSSTAFYSSLLSKSTLTYLALFSLACNEYTCLYLMCIRATASILLFFFLLVFLVYLNFLLLMKLDLC